ncbi:4'-phosphopantetheinyl transferase family protein [Pseudohongiella sp.]|uniref:4'-phosphopantetheinyl transferase domain-containing protein n=1 Tax=marine sediment metagenome TaxID=412755 RepID=A0A0F9W3P8_9ZZZZ|nr:4'-phosphopantetheinyl transferase superfamily protein [Pseudohongiella sp.]HDZ09578.1 4'-phosphopantetheinyl transferase superfamily protein [Pseudohongiella sp.]HEA62492.1 4'-phosphopantetheinyl transferase superfamily protein [Pseudohongiella sp.]
MTSLSEPVSADSEPLTALDLPASQIDLWLVPAVTDMAAVEQLAGAWLSDAERVRLNSRRLPKGRAMFLLTRAVTRRLLSAYCPDVEPGQWQLGRSAEGRPDVSGPVVAPVFNLSHTDDMLVLAFAAQGEPGVDIEALDRELDCMALAQRFFSPAEYQALRLLPALQQRERFLRLWTLKEACVKANGQGLARALRDFEFAFDDGLMFYPAPHEAPPHQHWRLWSTTLAGLRIALALRSQTDPGAPRLCVRQLLWPDRLHVVACRPEFTGST